MRWRFLPLLFPVAISQAQVTINTGLSGAWYNARTPGQGLLIDVIAERDQLFLAWFTFDDEATLAIGSPGQRWLTAQGVTFEDRAELTLFDTSGGRFNDAAPVNSEPAGSATLRFASCTRATLSFVLSDGPEGEIELERLTPDALCETAVATRPLPGYFRLTGLATGEDADGRSAECRLDLLYEVVETRQSPGVRHYAGFGGGEVSRSVLDAGGAGLAFFANFFVPDVSARAFAGGRLELTGPGVGVDDSRLYLNLARFEGELDADGAARGEWTCGPLDIDSGGYVDTAVTARGAWRIEPIEDNGTAASR